MRALLVSVGAFAVLLLVSATALAGRQKVQIETDPPGATVYLESTETSPVCEKTPCTIDMPAQETAIFIQLKNYQVVIDSLDPANKKLTKLKKTLEPATGGIVVKDGKGARVSIDDEDKGKAPDRFEVGEGGHHVVITGADGKTLFDEFVEVKVGEDAEVEVGVGAAAKGDGDGEKDDPNAKVTKPGPAPAHAHYLRAYVATDIGFRSFAYANNMTMTSLRDVSEGGEVLVGPAVEVWPLELAGVAKGRGLSIGGHVQFHVNHQPVDNPDTRSLTTFWQSLAVAARYRYVAADVVAFEPLVGYGLDQYRFSGNQNEVDLVPDAAYSSVRFGLKIAAVSLMAGKLEPYVEAENRIVISGGSLATRFTGGSSVSGLHGAAGLALHFGAIVGRIEGAITRYSWDFKYNSTSDMRVATGATDQISQVAIDVGYQY